MGNCDLPIPSILPFPFSLPPPDPRSLVPCSLSLPSLASIELAMVRALRSSTWCQGARVPGSNYSFIAAFHSLLPPYNSVPPPTPPPPPSPSPSPSLSPSPQVAQGMHVHMSITSSSYSPSSNPVHLVGVVPATYSLPRPRPSQCARATLTLVSNHTSLIPLIMLPLTI